MSRMTIVGLAGSLTETSSSLSALKLALEGAREAGAEVELLALHDLDLPMYPREEADPPASVRRLVEAVSGADGLIWSSPLYHGSISGAFKNALDWLELLSEHQPAYLTDKPVGLIATAGGSQGLQAINTMEYVVRALRGWTVPMTIPISRSWEAFDAHGQAQDPAVAQRLRDLGVQVTQAAERLGRTAAAAVR